MVASPSELSDLPSPEGVRMFALELLDEAARNAARLQESRDDEALHDFRVSVRRLRAWTRAFRAELADTVKPKYLDRLRHVQQISGGARDAEVQAEWLKKSLDELPPDAAVVAEQLRAAVEAEAGHGFDATGTLAHFHKAHSRLRPALSNWQLPMHVGQVGEVKPFAWSWMTALRQALADLFDAAGKVAGAHDAEQLHVTRIRIKRLRYVSEPLKGWPEAKGLTGLLKRRQEVLGELHDRHVLLDRTRLLTVEANPAGVEGIAALLRAQIGQLYAEHLESRAGDAELAAQVERICEQLHRRRALRVDYFPVDEG